MTLEHHELEQILDAMATATPDQLLLINKHSADLYKVAKRTEGRKVMATLQVGTRAMMGPNTRPKYLARQLGTIEEIRDTRVVFKLDRGPMGKFHNGRVVCNPASLTILKNQPKEN